MNKSEINELKKRFNIKKASFTRIAGCYVNDAREKTCTFSKQFLNLPEEEIFRYLEISGKLLSGKQGDNLLPLDFPTGEEMPGGHQAALMALRESQLKDDGLLDAFYDEVIGSYEMAGNYLILLYFDRYDIPVRTKDNLENEESDEVFSYLLCAICPVELSKPALSYMVEDNDFAAGIRNWMVELPESGFLFPAFNDRSTDIHQCMFYTKDTKMPHREFSDAVLGCVCKKTATEQKRAFFDAVADTLKAEERQTKETYADIQYALETAVTAHEELVGEDGDALILSESVLRDALEDAGIPEEKAEKILEKSAEILPGEDLPAANLLDTASVKEGTRRAEKRSLVELLHEKTEQIRSLTGDTGEDSISLYLKDSSEAGLYEIDGRLCLVVPVEDRKVTVNGKQI